MADAVAFADGDEVDVAYQAVVLEDNGAGNGRSFGSVSGSFVDGDGREGIVDVVVVVGRGIAGIALIGAVFGIPEVVGEGFDLDGVASVDDVFVARGIEAPDAARQGASVFGFEDDDVVLVEQVFRIAVGEAHPCDGRIAGVFLAAPRGGEAAHVDEVVPYVHVAAPADADGEVSHAEDFIVRYFDIVAGAQGETVGGETVGIEFIVADFAAGGAQSHVTEAAQGIEGKVVVRSRGGGGGGDSPDAHVAIVDGGTPVVNHIVMHVPVGGDHAAHVFAVEIDRDAGDFVVRISHVIQVNRHEALAAVASLPDGAVEDFEVRPVPQSGADTGGGFVVVGVVRPCVDDDGGGGFVVDDRVPVKVEFHVVGVDIDGQRGDGEVLREHVPGVALCEEVGRSAFYVVGDADNVVGERFGGKRMVAGRDGRAVVVLRKKTVVIRFAGFQPFEVMQVLVKVGFGLGGRMAVGGGFAVFDDGEGWQVGGEGYGAGCVGNVFPEADLLESRCAAERFFDKRLRRRGELG